MQPQQRPNQSNIGIFHFVAVPSMLEAAYFLFFAFKRIL